MYKVMLADDEGIVIDALSYIIEKNFPGQCAIEYAKTGRSVIELAERFSPDIAFMDIQMPGINGIDAMKEIRKRNPGIIFIVISAYDKFDYAWEAIQLGVHTYINKPINQQVIVDNLKQVMDKVDKEREKRSNDLRIKEKLNTVVPILENGFIYSVLFRQNLQEEVENYKTLLEIREDYGFVMVIKYGERQIKGQLTNPVGTTIKIQPYYQQLRDCFKDVFEGILGAAMTNVVIGYIPCEKQGKDEYEKRIYVIERARDLVNTLQRKLDFKFRIGIGTVRDMDQASQSYSEAMNALKYTDGAVVHARDLPIGCGYEEDYPVQTEKALLDAVERGNQTELIAQANRFFDWMIQYHGSQMMNVKLKVLEFVLWAEKIGYESGGMVYQFDSRSEYLEAVTACDDDESLRGWFLEKVTEACRNVQSKRMESSVSLVEKAQEYIKTHYQQDISLNEVSRAVDISPYYFSKLFKEETGENFIEYVTSIRIEKAKQLLRETSMSMKEICAEVGYSDPNYLSRTFKRHVGMTPTEYKEGE